MPAENDTSASATPPTASTKPAQGGQEPPSWDGRQHDYRMPLKTYDCRPIKRVSKQEFRRCLIFKQIRRVLGISYSFSPILHAFAVFRRAWLFDGLAAL